NKGPAVKRQVRLEIEERDPKRWPILKDGKMEPPPSPIRGQQSLDLPENGSRQAKFQLVGSGPGVYHGRIRFEQPDALTIDDEVTFTYQVRPVDGFLIVAPPDVSASLLDDAVSLRYTGTIVTPDKIDSLDLSGYNSICLLDPTPLPELSWKKLESYVESGVGLAIF